MDVDRLRAETRPEHEATEATLSLMSADLSLAEYASALHGLYTVLRGWEQWAAEHVPTAYERLLNERQRSRLIEKDLAFLQTPADKTSLSGVQQQLDLRLLGGNGAASLTPAAFLGTMYVVEGSTLGGQFIAKHVEELFGFQSGIGNAYFRGYGEHTGSMWRRFKDELIALPDEDADEVILAAKAMFGVFATAMADHYAA